LLLAAVLLSSLSVFVFAQNSTLPAPDQLRSIADNPPLQTVAPSVEKSFDQLLDEVEQVRARKAELDKQKAELEKKEQELLAEARKKLEKQNDRINRMTGTPNTPALPSGLTLPPSFPGPSGTPSPSRGH
jgi:cell shape-determining protein MreC